MDITRTSEALSALELKFNPILHVVSSMPALSAPGNASYRVSFFWRQPVRRMAISREMADRMDEDPPNKLIY